jgi:hypothetical protein
MSHRCPIVMLKQLVGQVEMRVGALEMGFAFLRF